MEEIKKIEVQGQQYGVADMLMRSVMGGNAQVIEWSHTHNMNDYKEAGTYRIKGERTGNPLDDNLPIMNQGSGHTIEGILYVFDSSLTNGSGNSDDCTITQFLMLSNRVGGQEGDMYMRSAYGVNKDNLTWKPWEKYQTNMEVGQVNSLDNLIDNGIYSGVWTDGTPTSIGSFYDTFVLVVINNYAVSGPLGQTRSISQFKYSLGVDGTVTFKSRVGQGGSSISWGNWDRLATNSEVDDVKTKQLQLSVKDNGNIVLSNTNGVTKEFMPATPSGDPMHYAYEATGAVYNAGDDYIAETPWASLVDDADYNAKWGLNLIPDNATFVKTLKYKGVDREVWQMTHPNKNMQIWVVADYASDGTKIWDDTLLVKRSGMWYLLGLGDLTNAQMNDIFRSGHPPVTIGAGSVGKGRIILIYNGLTNAILPNYYAYYNAYTEVLEIGYYPELSGQNYDFRYIKYIKHADYKASNLGIKNTSLYAPYLSCGILRFEQTANPSIERISAKSMMKSLQESKPLTAITLTFPSALYDRLMDTSTTLGAELVALLESKSNITFARGE